MEKYELHFLNISHVPNFVRQKLAFDRYHESYEDAKAEAIRVLSINQHRAAHPAIIEGPGCGKHGVVIF